ncbi:MAG: carboxymuconolactone decarboxylase [Candidatus Cloacimonadota bacterium]|nr:MAG: carboxymuconolactone decarboxylase [Candidatus Cloacimonadota bacterium]
MWKQNRMKDGESKGRELLGNKWDKIIEALSSQNQDITKYIVEWAYGEVYNRPGLTLKQRELISITSLAMQGRDSQLKTHIYAALNIGLTKDEIMETFIHLALFSGFPTALDAIKIAKEIFDKPSPEDTGVDPKHILEKDNA